MSSERKAPDLADLSAYLDGELSPEESLRVEEAIARDPAFAAEWDALRETSQSLRSLPTLRAPQSILAGVRSELEAERIAARPTLFSSFGSWAALFLLATTSFVFFQLDPANDRGTPTVRNSIPPTRSPVVSPTSESAPPKGAPEKNARKSKTDARALVATGSDASRSSAPIPGKKPLASDFETGAVTLGDEPPTPSALGKIGENREIVIQKDQARQRSAGSIDEPKSQARSKRGAAREEARSTAPSIKSMTLGSDPPAPGSRASTAPTVPVDGSRSTGVEAREILDAMLPVLERSLGESATEFELSLSEKLSSPSPPTPAEWDAPTREEAAPVETAQAETADEDLAQKPEMKRGRAAPAGKQDDTRARVGDTTKGVDIAGIEREITVRMRLPAATTAEDLERLTASIGRAYQLPTLLAAKETEKETKISARRTGKDRLEKKRSPRGSSAGATTGVAETDLRDRSDADPFAGLPPLLRAARPYSDSLAPELTLAGEFSPAQVLAALEALDRWRTRRPAQPVFLDEETSPETDDRGDESPEGDDLPGLLLLEGNPLLLEALRSALASRQQALHSAELREGRGHDGKSGEPQGEASDPLRALFESSAAGENPTPIRLRIVLEALDTEPAPAEETRL